MRSIIALLLTIALCAPALADTTANNGPNIYVPDYRMQKIYQDRIGEIYGVRGSLRRMGDFIELWARVIPKNSSQEVLDSWNREKIAITADTAYAQVKLHLYCSSNMAAIPAAYMLDNYSQIIASSVVMMDDAFALGDKPVLSQLEKLACSGKIDRLSDGRD